MRFRGEGKQCPNQAVRALGAWYRGVSPPLLTLTRRGQLNYACLTASVCCVLCVCLDSPALLSQQLNNRWLKKASIQSGLDQKITPRKVHKLQTKHTVTPHAHTCKLHGLSVQHILQMKEKQIGFCLLQTVIASAQNRMQRHNWETYETTPK